MKINKLKKGDISINMVIVAAIAIIVLLVMVMIFSGKMRGFGQTMQSCESQGGTCSNGGEGSTCESAGINCKSLCGGNTDSSIVIRNTDCEQEENAFKVCCKSIY